MKKYAERPIDEDDRLGELYYEHVDAMTGEGLDSKSSIAAELAYRDQQIESLRAELQAAQDEIKSICLTVIEVADK